MTLQIPLFPLQTVLFPGGPLPLRIFEPRYLDMVSHCLKSGTGIGVVLIRDGSEVGVAATTHEVGTVSQITYWNRLSNGILGITVRGEQRFQILSQQVQSSQLVLADVELIPNDPELAIPHKYQPMVSFLHQIIEQLEPPYTTMPTKYDDASWISARLVELLPMDLSQKQLFLKLDDPIQRLDRLDAILQDMEVW